ncbi:hypothetical protein [Microvirga puerhi]|uniref:Uncharacterized protein n=1 Tax=Microvirga puerhi TaxID=2876078 RepID=A0ABS7VPN0_9HYPH|nr:hypothetical protein [Microvirga puerhi]MBZ6077169.1 hypothetical protein [Microvirga puerhi]
MPSTISFDLDLGLCDAFPPRQGTCHVALRAAGSRTVLEEGPEANSPPAGTARMQTAFEWMGFALMALIMGTAVWILIRGRL